LPPLLPPPFDSHCKECGEEERMSAEEREWRATNPYMQTYAEQLVRAETAGSTVEAMLVGLAHLHECMHAHICELATVVGGLEARVENEKQKSTAMLREVERLRRELGRRGVTSEDRALQDELEEDLFGGRRETSGKGEGEGGRSESRGELRKRSSEEERGRENGKRRKEGEERESNWKYRSQHGREWGRREEREVEVERWGVPRKRLVQAEERRESPVRELVVFDCRSEAPELPRPKGEKGSRGEESRGEEVGVEVGGRRKRREEERSREKQNRRRKVEVEEEEEEEELAREVEGEADEESSEEVEEVRAREKNNTIRLHLPATRPPPSRRPPADFYSHPVATPKTPTQTTHSRHSPSPYLHQHHHNTYHNKHKPSRASGFYHSDKPHFD